MMLRTLVASALFTLSAQASHLDTVCKSALEFSPRFTDGLVAWVTPDREMVVDDFNGNRVFQHTSAIRGLVSTSDRMWVLTFSELLELNKDGSLVQSHNITHNISMTLAGDILIIVRNGGMVSALHTKTGELAWTNYMQDVPGGEARAAAFDGKNVHLVMVTAYENGFTGVATIDPKTGNVLKKLSYDVYRSGVIGVDVSARWYKDQLVLNNSGWIHVITAKQLADKKNLRPRWVALRLSPNENPYYMMLKGEFFMDSNELVGCGMNRIGIGPEMQIGTALYRVKMP